MKKIITFLMVMILTISTTCICFAKEKPKTTEEILVDNIEDYEITDNPNDVKLKKITTIYYDEKKVIDKEAYVEKIHHNENKSNKPSTTAKTSMEVSWNNISNSIEMKKTSTRSEQDILGSYSYIASNNVDIYSHTRGGVAYGNKYSTNNTIDGGTIQINTDGFVEYWTQVAKDIKAIEVTNDNGLAYNYVEKQIAKNLSCNTDSEVRVNDIPIYYFSGESITWSGVYGILIAPNADVTINPSNACGCVIAKNITSNAEYHLFDWNSSNKEWDEEINHDEEYHIEYIPREKVEYVYGKLKNIPTTETTTESIEPTTEPKTSETTTEKITTEITTTEQEITTTESTEVVTTTEQEETTTTTEQEKEITTQEATTEEKQTTEKEIVAIETPTTENVTTTTEKEIVTTTETNTTTEITTQTETTTTTESKTPNTPNVPKTSDKTNLLLIVVLLILCGCGLGITIIFRDKNNDE